MTNVRLQIKRKEGCDDIPIPQYMSQGASGLDVCAAVTEDVTLAPGDVKFIPTGLFVAVAPGFEIQVRPRSGLALKHGITIVNSPGTIDSDYRGEVGIILGNIGRQPFIVTRGMRVAQLVVQSVAHAEIEVCEELDDTPRSAGGFGHTGH